MSEKKTFTVSEIREKLMRYCAYQERCQWEVEKKLQEFRLIPEGRDEIMIYLIQNGFLNEERFARSFARGKFYQKNWGRIKIRMELKKRKIPPKLIEIGLAEINDKDYQNSIKSLFEKKKKALKSERDSFKKKGKIRNYLIQKGFESEFIMELLLNS